MTILFIDDEKRRMDSFAMELQLSGNEVIFCDQVDTAWSYFENHSDEIKLIVLDIMMPHGDLFEEDSTDDGLRTGSLLYERIRENKPDMPVVIFTNVSDEEVADGFRLETNCLYLQKKDYYPNEFVREIEKLMNSKEG
jgi:DNA-binding response OmpR family regulator